MCIRDRIKGDMNPFDADCRLYFNKRMKSKMLVTLKGRKALLYLWEKQGRKCPICGEPIDTHKAVSYTHLDVYKRQVLPLSEG